jgi:hypothetical protein
VDIQKVVITGRWIRVLPGREAGFLAPNKLTVHVDGIEIDIAINAKKDRYAVRAIRGNDLTGEKLRSLKLAEIVGDTLENLTANTELGAPPAVFDVIQRFGGEVDEFSKLREDERVHIVSLLYAFAYITGQRPTAYVTKVLGIPRSTASRLIKKGRMGEQWLGTTTEGKAGV